MTDPLHDCHERIKAARIRLGLDPAPDAPVWLVTADRLQEVYSTGFTGTNATALSHSAFFSGARVAEREILAGRRCLTREQIQDEASYHGFLGNVDQLVDFVRGIERRHGVVEL